MTKGGGGKGKGLSGDGVENFFGNGNAVAGGSGTGPAINGDAAPSSKGKEKADTNGDGDVPDEGEAVRAAEADVYAEDEEPEEDPIWTDFSADYYEGEFPSLSISLTRRFEEADAGSMYPGTYSGRTTSLGIA